MIFNYLKIACRHLWKNKIYSFINIVGLSAGIAVSILILLFVSHEYSFDRFHENGDNIYLKITRLDLDGQTIQLFSTPEFAPELKETNHEVINYCRMISISGKVIKPDPDHKFIEDHVLFADTSFFSMFSFDLIKGSAKSLVRPNTIVLTEETTRKYFGDVDPIGKTIYFDRDNLFEVVGVARKTPSNSTIQFNCIASLSSIGSMPAYKDGYLGNPAYQTFLLLNETTDISALEQLISKSQHAGENEQHILEPLASIHASASVGVPSNAKYVFTFLCIALFILILALINYMNLAAARAATRAKEVGIRKIAGAGRRGLSIQFYLEALTTTAISFGIAFVLVQILTPIFLNILGQQIDTTFLHSPTFITAVVALFVFCVLLSGSYPALILPRFNIIDSIKGRLQNRFASLGIRNVLTVFQFSVSFILIVCSLVVYKQLTFMRNKNIGLERDMILIIPVDGSASKGYYSFKNELRNQTGVKQVAAASVSLFKGGYNMVGLETPTTHENVTVNIFTVDQNFPETLGMEWEMKPEKILAAGNYLVNEAALARLKISEHPLGQQLAIHDGRQLVTNDITGVLSNFNFAPLHSIIDPLIMTVESDTAGILKYGGSLYVQLDESINLPEKIEAFKKIYEKYQSEIPFDYIFLDEAFNRMYKNEEQLAKIFAAFTFVAIGIACLGLFGLVNFVTERRTKEVGIRKVLGASVQSIVILLSNNFLGVVTVALIIASPVAYIIIKKWLANFAYQINMSWMVFAVAAATLIVIALATISFQTIKSAYANPTESLRNE
jgi:putative ABC transport system permease protein